MANYRYAPCLGECGGGILLTKLVGEGESERYLLITDRRENEREGERDSYICTRGVCPITR